MDKHDLQALAFPRLSDAELASLATCPNTKLKHYRAGETLFDAGDREFAFNIVKSGEVEILDVSQEPPKTVTIHHPGEFTGEVSQLTGTPALVKAVARHDSDVFELPPKAVNQLINHHPDLGDTILQAF